jgi:hypothetical protein
VAFGEIVTTALLHILSKLIKYLREGKRIYQGGKATLMPPEKFPRLIV